MCACVFKLNSDVRWPLFFSFSFFFRPFWNFNFYIPELLLAYFFSSCQHVHLWWILNEKRSAHLTVAVVKPCKRANHFIHLSWEKEKEQKIGKNQTHTHTHTLTRQKKANADSNNPPMPRSLITHTTQKSKEREIAVRLMRAASFVIEFGLFVVVCCCCWCLILSLLLCLMFNYRRGLVFLLPQKPIWVII